MKNSDGTTSKSSKNSGSTVDYLMGSMGTTQRKNKNSKNLMLSNIEPQNGSSSSSTPSLQPTQNLSPISQTSQVPSPLTTVTPTSSKFAKIL